MKKDLHPKYGEAVVTCACGEVWHIKSTRPEYKVGICAKCHPFFTGKQKFVDTAGRIDKFNLRYKKQGCSARFMEFMGLPGAFSRQAFFGI